MNRIDGLTENTAEEIFRRTDADGSGEITFSEFVTAGASVLTSDKNLESAFEKLDTECDRKLDQRELQAAFSRLGHYNADKEEIWRSFIAGCDTNGDGCIDENEFKTAIRKAMN